MIAGHFGLAAMVKGQERATPLWALMLATVWLDVIFVPLFLMKIETMEPAADAKRAYGGSLIHADYTHSLAGAVVLSAVLGGLGNWFWGRRAGIVIGLVSFSHWLLDLIVHRADLPILPGDAGGLPRLGLGLWAEPIPSALLELGLVVVGAAIYWHAAISAARAAGSSELLARASGLLMLCSGLLVLWLDFSSEA